MPAPLPVTPPHDDGFRLRGVEMTRLETFTDAAFAFAATMLVLSLEEIPRDSTQLFDMLRGTPAFLASLATLMVFWAGHRRFSRRYGLEDVPTILLTVGLIAVMLVYVYPLKFMFTVAFEHLLPWVCIPSTRVPRVATGVTGPSDLSNVFITYGIGFVVFNFIFLLLFSHAHRLRERLSLSPLEVYDTRTDMGMFLIFVATGIVSIALALALRGAGLWVILAGWIYASLAITMPIYGVHRDRRRRPVRDADQAA